MTNKEVGYFALITIILSIIIGNYFIFVGPKDKELARLKLEVATLSEPKEEVKETAELSTLIEIRDILKSCKEEADRMIREERPND